MVCLYFFRFHKENQRALWQEKLAEILERDWRICNAEIILRPDGKPALRGDKVFFNVAHSREQLVIAIADCEVGVDIEFFDRPVSERLRRHALTEGEQNAVSPNDASGFFRIWTAKESYLKLYGTGLRQPMNRFSVFGDVFSSSELPPAVFQRVKGEGFTVCVATEKKESVQIKEK